MADKVTTDQIDALFDSGGDVLPFADEATFERPWLGQTPNHEAIPCRQYDDV